MVDDAKSPQSALFKAWSACGYVFSWLGDRIEAVMLWVRSRATDCFWQAWLAEQDAAKSSKEDS